MSSPAMALVTEFSPKARLAVLFAEVAELTGQRNAIDGRLVEIVAEIEDRDLVGMTGVRSTPALVAWKFGTSPNNADTIVAVARRLTEFPRLGAGLREGRVSLDQAGVIAERAADGSDEHYAELAAVLTVTQLRTAVKMEPRPDPDPSRKPKPQRSIGKTTDGDATIWRIRLPHVESATFDAALQSHTDALVADWKRDHDAGGDAEDESGGVSDDSGDGDGASAQAPPFPSLVDGFMSLIEAGWDSDVARRPHGQRTTVVVHLDVENRNAALHLGPFLAESDRRYLMCEADCEIWFERHGHVIGSGRATRHISRRLRRALEHRDRCCVVPGCGATRGLHAHHIRHWEDGGLTELFNLVLICPFHHRLHHRGAITISGPADHLVITDADGQPLHAGSLARPPTRPPPAVKPYPGPTGERADWWWYTPFQPPPPLANNRAAGSGHRQRHRGAQTG